MEEADVEDSLGDEGVDERENFCENQDRIPEVCSDGTKFSRLEDEEGILDEDLLR